MAYQFKFNTEKIILDFQFFLFEEFTSIWEKDKSKDKASANKMLFFIFLLCDISEDNEFRNIDSNKREEEALFRVYGKRDKKFIKRELDLLEPGIKLYVDLNTTSEERLLHVFDKKAKEISNTLEVTIPETITNVESGVVTFVSNSKIIADALSKLAKIRKNREKIIASIKKESVTQKIRGKLTLSPLIKGLIKIK